MRGIQYIPDNTQFNFLGMRIGAFVLSAILLLGSLFFIVDRGLNLGVDFTGGTVIEIRTPVTPDLGELRVALNDLDVGSVSIQEFGQPDDLLIRMQEQKGGPEAQKAAIDSVRRALDTRYEDDGEVDYRRVEFVGPQVGEELKRKGLYAVLASLLGIMAYVWFRFEWQYGMTALVALIHDSILTIGLFAFTQMEFNLSTVAAILMVAGYSINDTVVVFDRIRENMRKYKKMVLKDLLNLTVNQTLSRTVMTSITTLLALFALAYFGGEVIRGFTLALIFGIFVGTYSSIYVASPLLLFMNVRQNKAPSEQPA